MASMESSGIAETIRKLQNADLFTDETVKNMLTAGSDVALQAVKSAFISAGHNNPGQPRRTGETLRHFGRTKTVKKDKRGNPFLTVTVLGKDRRGERYGAKAFVLNYGRRNGGKIKADYYWSTAIQNTSQSVSHAMEDIADKKLKEV